MRSARIARILAAVLSPLATLLILVGNALTPGKGYREGPFASQAELRELVDLAGASDLIEDDERQMIHSVFELGDTVARELMVPRARIEALALKLDARVDAPVGPATTLDLVALELASTALVLPAGTTRLTPCRTWRRAS